nr:immunoglobulin heavy chain junction region [Mus musculus]MBK4189168.1 immunoglobulin heavy chain junction region [Mus musculus]
CARGNDGYYGGLDYW